MAGNPDTVSFESGKVASVELPARVAELLQAEAKRARKPIAKLVLDWLETQQDIRDSRKVMADIQSGKTKAIPWATARKELLDAP